MMSIHDEKLAEIPHPRPLRRSLTFAMRASIEIPANNNQTASFLPIRHHRIRDYGFIIIIIADPTGTDNNGANADQIIAFRLSTLPERRRVRRVDAKAISFR